MHGPMPARIRSGRAPSLVIAATVASMIPASAPRQPPCAAPMIRASGSANRTGAQSAASTPSAMPGTRCHHRVGAGIFLAPPGALDGDRGGAVDLMATDQPIGREARAGTPRSRGSAATLSGASREPKPQFSDANTPPLTPPRRVKKAWRMPGSGPGNSASAPM